MDKLYELGMEYLSGGPDIAEDESKALECFCVLAEKKYDPALSILYNLGCKYLIVKGEKYNDINKAIEYFKIAANQGYDKAIKGLYKIGISYLTGDQRLKRNYNKAVELLKYLADHDYTNAQFCLGLCYLYGEIKEWNRVGAHFIKSKSSECADFIDRLYRLGVDFINDDRTIVQSKAFEYFQSAADKGDANAQYCLGLCYLHGR